MKYTVVVVNSLYEQINSDLVKEFLHKIFRLKKRGYGSRHVETYIPVGKEDFVGTHILICKQINQELLPVCISKIIFSDVLEKYNLEHPTLSILRGHCGDDYFKHIEKIINNHLTNEELISYSGGFTVDRNNIEGVDELEILKEIYCGVHTLIHETRGAHTLFGFSCPRLRTDKFFLNWGIAPILLNGEAPSSYPDSLHNEEVKCISAKVSDLSDYSKFMARKYYDLWATRLENEEEVYLIAG